MEGTYAIVLLGMAGSGKSTVGRLLADQLGFDYLSTGEIARKRIGGMWQELGMPAPEEEMKKAFDFELALLLSGGSEGVIIDGLPRKPEQVGYLNEWGQLAKHYYVLETDIDTARDRLIGRGRADDTAVAITNRLATYKSNIRKILVEIAEPVVTIDTTHRDPQQIADIIATRIY